MTIEIPGQPHLKVLQESPMSLHTTWGIGGPADLLVRVPTPDDFIAAVRWANVEGLPVTVIGSGSNLLVREGGIRGLVISCRTPGQRAEGLLEAEDGGDSIIVRVGAQAPLSWVGRYASERGWAGMDWGVGLPGNIGGATVNNAGAHGTEMKDALESVVVLDNTGEVAEYPRSWLKPSYRYTTIKASPRPRNHHVLSVTLRLQKGDPAELMLLSQSHADYRHQTQPTGKCAGSTFTNPPNDFAGRLLEAAGMKGYQVGGVSFSTKHSNFIVNSGNATASEVQELIATARQRVEAEFGIHLHPEIEIIGEP
jgi:UDP-N-acetylmuramate dehydrogenase